LRIWLTKDEHMTPQILSPNHERGYYIVWDTSSWRKDRVSYCTRQQGQKATKLTEDFQREFTLHYGDLDTTLNQA
jgi:CCR4-NOT transcription complex subunit 2